VVELSPLKIVFLVRSLDFGGAERQLIVLARGLQQVGHRVVVGSFYSNGRFQGDLEREGVSVVPLGKGSRWDVARFLLRLVRLVRTEKPTVLHTYLTVPNILAAGLKVIFPRLKTVWGIRASNMDLTMYDWLARLTDRLERRLAPVADLIIVNSESGRQYHLARGYPARKLLTVPNGIDTEEFRPDSSERDRVRGEWRLGSAERLIGIVGRFDPMKDHETFFRAAARLSKDIDNVRFAVVGDGKSEYREELNRLAEVLGIKSSVLWVSSRNDMPAVYNALDILSLSSAFGEGFPNVVGEAMACGVPCVVTDIGDSALIVGDTGVVVPPKNPEALAKGWKVMLERLTREGGALSARARSRVVENFRRELLVERTAQVLAALV
jgi:glycosyltransferase involved in cell wall biosynthesis